MAEVHLLCGPAGSGKTARLLGRFRERARAAPGAALWLAPTLRAAEAIRPLVPGFLPALCGPQLLSFGDFFEEVIRCNDPAVQPLSAVQQRLLVEEVVGRLADEGKLSYFGRVIDTRGFIEGLLNQLTELRRQQVSPFRFARAAYRRGTDGAPVDPRAPGGRGIALKDRQCARLYAHYQRELRRLRLLDVEGRPAHALDLLRQDRWQPFAAVRAVFVDGFTDFTAAQFQALALLARRAEELWIALPDEAEEQRAELFSRSRAARERLKEELAAVETSFQRARDSDTVETCPCRPVGLRHLEAQLFRPLRAVQPADRADGVSLIEAPGMLGEARLVARRIKTLVLRDNVPLGSIIVALRDVSPYADLLHEVFDEYGLPLDLEGIEPLTHNPAVAVLLRTLRLPEDDWPFASVTALLRNTYFRPDWPERHACPEIAQHAEALLRLLGEPRGRDAYLNAVERWAEQQQPGLEDEQAEESRRRRIHQLARLCAPFLQRFFRAWDRAPGNASLAEHVAWLRQFTEDLGLGVAAGEDGRDRAALARFWEEIVYWQRRERQGGGMQPGRLERKTFHRRLGALAATAGLARTPRGPGRVRVLSAELARHLDADFLFLMGLGERSFPRLAAVPTLLDERERLAFKRAGLDLPAADLVPDEMLLFYQLVTRPRRGLVLSYPAVDERGQELLPSSFLTAALDCFTPGTVPVERRRMLIERFNSDTPLSPAEYRVRVAAAGAASRAAHNVGRDSVADPAAERRTTMARLAGPTAANLIDAARLIERRFLDRDHNPYDGLFRDAAVIGELVQMFGPERILSPTALEDYVACPFRFFLGNVLRLEPLEEPREEIEVTRRGQAVHRALARLHQRLKKDDVHRPTEAVTQQVVHEIEASVEEDVLRAPSAAAKQLWRLEGQRLLRVARRYPSHWQKFLAPWLERGIGPRPHFFEVDFGLPSAEVPGGAAEAPHPPLVIRDELIEVRISGRIDRVDLAELPGGEVGFWIIDYKTGRASHYTSTDLAEFRRLQLTLYALAVQEVLLAGQSARPLGLAYWLVAEAGAKVVLPTRNQLLWLDEAQRWRAVREQLQRWVLTLVRNIRGGVFPLQPRSERCTQTCDYGQICRITQARAVQKEWSLPLPVVGATPEGPAATS